MCAERKARDVCASEKKCQVFFVHKQECLHNVLTYTGHAVARYNCALRYVTCWYRLQNSRPDLRGQ